VVISVFCVAARGAALPSTAGWQAAAATARTPGGAAAGSGCAWLAVHRSEQIKPGKEILSE